jgi:phosphatidylglycerophosphatase A
MKEQLISAVRRIFSTCFYIGYIPGPAGTYGSLLCVALLYFFMDNARFIFLAPNAHLFLLGFIIFVFAGFWLCDDTLNNFGEDDPNKVNIDEFAGQAITFLFVPLSIPVLLVGFILFRFFDIVKPYPIHVFERLEEGVGIMADDVVAGIMACVSLNLLLGAYGIIIARIQ